MVRTRGLGRALASVVGRAVGGRGAGQEEEVAERRRPTASARREQALLLVQEDAQAAHEDPQPAQEDPQAAHEDAQPPQEDPPAEEDAVHDTDVRDDAGDGFPGGPSDMSVLTAYADHVAPRIWAGEVI